MIQHKIPTRDARLNMKPTCANIDVELTTKQEQRMDKLRHERNVAKARLTKAKSQIRTAERNFRNQRRDEKAEALQGCIEPNPGYDGWIPSDNLLVNARVWFLSKDPFGRPWVQGYVAQLGTAIPALCWTVDFSLPPGRHDVVEFDSIAAGCRNGEFTGKLPYFRDVRLLTCMTATGVAGQILQGAKTVLTWDANELYVAMPAIQGAPSSSILVYAFGESEHPHDLIDGYDTAGFPSCQEAPCMFLSCTTFRVATPSGFSRERRFVSPGRNASAWLRILLIMAGIEPNPGFAQPVRPERKSKPFTTVDVLKRVSTVAQALPFPVPHPDLTFRVHANCARYPNPAAWKRAVFMLSDYRDMGSFRWYKTVQQFYELIDLAFVDAAAETKTAPANSTQQVRAAMELGLPAAPAALSPASGLQAPAPPAQGESRDLAPSAPPAPRTALRIQRPFPSTPAERLQEPLVVPEPEPPGNVGTYQPPRMEEVAPPMPDPEVPVPTPPNTPDPEPEDNSDDEQGNGPSEEWQMSKKNLLDGHHLSRREVAQVLDRIGWDRKSFLYWTLFGWPVFMNVDLRYVRKRYSREARPATWRTVNEISWDMVVGELNIKLPGHILFWLIVLCLTSLLTSASLLGTGCYHLQRFFVTTPEIWRPMVDLYAGPCETTLGGIALWSGTLAWTALLIILHTLWHLLSCVVLTLSSGLVFWTLVYLTITVFLYKEIKMIFIPHALTSVLTEFELRPSSQYDSLEIRKRLRRLACLPAVDRWGYKLLQGTELVVSALVHDQDFTVAGWGMASSASAWVRYGPLLHCVCTPRDTASVSVPARLYAPAPWSWAT